MPASSRLRRLRYSARRLFPNDTSVAGKVEAAWVKVGLLDTGVDLARIPGDRPASAGLWDRATSQRPLPCAAVVALPAP